jgi:crotonobetainyl-CoA:carnitine CoA-transferase CaiB-like acyl-CoA transferase
VVELADQLGEACGKMLSSLGADVIKVEPPEGEATRRIGPFLDDEPGENRSLHFWHYNVGKRGQVVDLDTEDGRDRLHALLDDADVLLETRPRGYLPERGFAYEELAARNPRLIHARITPFGDDGPWADYRGSDLVHLALGGIMMNCGYDPEPSGFYETPPVAPQMWQAYQITGEMTVLAVLAALHARDRTGRGQVVSTTVHQAVAQATEQDIGRWIYQRKVHRRLTARHSAPAPTPAGMTMTKDGRWLATYRTYLAMQGSQNKAGFLGLVELLDRHGAAGDLTDEHYLDPKVQADPATDEHVVAMLARFVGSYLFERDLWREAQEFQQTWAPIRKPEENVADEHWQMRGAVTRVEHPELGRSFDYTGAKWLCAQAPWRTGKRAPLLGEHGEEGFEARPEAAVVAKGGAETDAGREFPLEGVRVIDLGWIIASGSAGRYLAALGAEVIRVEHIGRPDLLRWSGTAVPEGGRAELEAADGPLDPGTPESPDRDGFFGEANAGKRAISLNLRTERGKEILAELIADADAVIEGFSPGAFARMGFPWERLQEINPSIVYAAQSSMGAAGRYPSTRGFGPTAAGIAGLTDMSGLPEPFPPAGIGYSYLDLFGAYNLAMAVLAGVYRRRHTGEGCAIDASQAECGIYLSGTAILDHSANGRTWHRYGNRSPYLAAAPHGAYRAAGEDRWVAIACFDEGQWRSFARVIGDPAWCGEARFATIEDRCANQEELDRLVEEATVGREPYELMEALQRAGVPAGVCQTPGDRTDRDAQLAHLEWTVELTHSEFGTWPVKDFPATMSETPPRIGGRIERHGPCYGEDNEYVFGELLGLTKANLEELSRDEVI